MLTVPPFIHDIMSHGTLGVVVGIILFCYILEDGALILSASLAATGVVPPIVAWAAVFFGICTGDFGIYVIARILRRPMGPVEFKTTTALSNRELFLCRFVPGLRTVAYAWCGMNRMPLWRFGQVVFWSGIVWTAGVFTLIYGVGAQLENLPVYWKLIPVLLVIGLMLWWRRHWRPSFLDKSDDSSNNSPDADGNPHTASDATR